MGHFKVLYISLYGRAHAFIWPYTSSLLDAFHPTMAAAVRGTMPGCATSLKEISDIGRRSRLRLRRLRPYIGGECATGTEWGRGGLGGAGGGERHVGSVVGVDSFDDGSGSGGSGGSGIRTRHCVGCTDAGRCIAGSGDGGDSPGQTYRWGNTCPWHAGYLQGSALPTSGSSDSAHGLAFGTLCGRGGSGGIFSPPFLHRHGSISRDSHG